MRRAAVAARFDALLASAPPPAQCESASRYAPRLAMRVFRQPRAARSITDTMQRRDVCAPPPRCLLRAAFKAPPCVAALMPPLYAALSMMPSSGRAGFESRRRSRATSYAAAMPPYYGACAHVATRLLIKGACRFSPLMLPPLFTFVAAVTPLRYAWRVMPRYIRCMPRFFARVVFKA